MTKGLEITNQIEVIRTISFILKDQIKNIESKGRSISSIPENSESLLFVAYKNYAQLFVDTVDFLIEKLETEKDENFRFHLVHIRTLLDIFSSLLYILNQEKSKQLAIIVLDGLTMLSKSIKYKDDSGLKSEYERYLNLYGNDLKKLGIDVPKDPTAFSKTSVKNLGYNFPNTEVILNEKDIKNSCPQASKIPNSAKSLYGVQSHFSSYVHGNPLTASKFGNENFWIIAKTEEICFFMSDLIDTLILDGIFKYKIDTWVRHKKKYAKEFINHWRARSEKISANHIKNDR